MKSLLLALSVFITVSETVPWACASAKPTPRPLVKWSDGTYRHDVPSIGYSDLILHTCTTSRVEEWTDLPEAGGRFIRALPNDER